MKTSYAIFNTNLRKMSVNCNVPGCKNTNRKTSKSFYDGRFIRFPTNKERQQKWRDSIQITKGYACGIHFEKSAWRLEDVIMEVPARKRRLKAGAVPTLHINQENVFDEKQRKALIMEILKDSEEMCNVDDNKLKEVDANIETDITKPQSSSNALDKKEALHNGLIQAEANIAKPQIQNLGAELKYGEVVFNSNENKLIVCCKFCMEKYYSLECFMKHILCRHIQFHNNGVLIKKHATIAKLFPNNNNNNNNNNNLNNMKAFETISGMAPFNVQNASQESLIISLIELYEKQPSLWNLRHENYFQKALYTQELEVLFLKICDEVMGLHLNTIKELLMQLETLHYWFSAVEYIRLQAKRDKKTFECKFPKLYNALEFLRGNVPPYQCTFCLVVFKTESNFLTHFGNNQRCSNLLNGVVYECKHCSKRFSEQRRLKSHMRQHTNEQPYQCTACKKSFRTYSNFYRHKQRKHLKKPHQCNNCKLAFITNGELLQHQNVHSGMRNVICEICGLSYLSNKYLNRHIRTVHRKETPKKLVGPNSSCISRPQRKYVITIVQNKQSQHSKISKTISDDPIT